MEEDFNVGIIVSGNQNVTTGVGRCAGFSFSEMISLQSFRHELLLEFQLIKITLRLTFLDIRSPVTKLVTSSNVVLLEEFS
jgi:hypothetical protein